MPRTMFTLVSKRQFLKQNTVPEKPKIPKNSRIRKFRIFVFLGFLVDPKFAETCLDRSGSSRCSFSTRNQPKRPHLRPFHGSFLFPTKILLHDRNKKSPESHPTAGLSYQMGGGCTGTSGLASMSINSVPCQVLNLWLQRPT